MLIPLNKMIKLILLVIHTVGFSVWFGSTALADPTPEIFPALVIGSGVLLLARKIIKHGWGWLCCVKGCITMFKAVILITGTYFLSSIVLLGTAMICGLLSTHLPKEIKDRKLI